MLSLWTSRECRYPDADNRQPRGGDRVVAGRVTCERVEFPLDDVSMGSWNAMDG